jgi:diguanylate cyclase (GGDEF)-like protein
VLFIDLDLFKRVNDTMGHDAGDEVLRQIGSRLAAVVRAPDTAARLGGDEFLIICAVANEEDTRQIVERVQQAVSRPVVAANKSYGLTASIGVSTTTQASADPDELVRRADVAMYEAKHHGRDGWQAYNDRLHHRASARQGVELELRQALKHDLFKLHYQPIFDLADGSLVGAEALLRVERANGRLLFPGSFIEVAERSDLIRPITDWVMQSACAQLAEWSPPPSFHLALNLSGRDLTDLAVAGRVLECALRHGVTPSQLVLELTEGVLIEGEQVVVNELHRLKEAGSRLAIDDFGTGYCSLTYLERFPVDAVKIDRSFVSGLAANSLHSTAIVDAVVALCKTLNLTCIAEGIEEPDQLLMLRSLGCQWGQGFYLGVPMEGEEFAMLFSRDAATGQDHGTVL